jgi:hypothetical protein
MIIGQPKAAYEQLTQKFELEIPFSSDQEDLFRSEKRVSLSPEQMDGLVDQISSRYGTSAFLMQNVTKIPPVGMSLFVLNNDLWKMMERKPWEEDKMLAMSTIPFCFWEQKEESTSNPKAVKRWDLGSSEMVFRSKPLSLSIAGNGGDFCGFIEQRMITSRRFGLPESKKLIPNYKFKSLEVTADLSKADMQVHPLPMENLDYDFSMSAKEFHNHGVQIAIPGKYVTLNVEKRKPAKLKGEVHILIAAAFNDENEHFRALVADVWFWTFQRFVGATK